MDKKTANEIIDLIQNMENDERWKLLEKLFHLYFNKENIPEDENFEEDNN